MGRSLLISGAAMAPPPKKWPPTESKAIMDTLRAIRVGLTITVPSRFILPSVSSSADKSRTPVVSSSKDASDLCQAGCSKKSSALLVVKVGTHEKFTIGFHPPLTRSQHENRIGHPSQRRLGASPIRSSSP